MRNTYRRGSVRGWNAHQSERESEEASEKAIPVAAKRYQEQLDKEIEADRTAHGKKPLKKEEKGDDASEARPSAAEKERVAVESSADPESGLFHKGERRKCFAYEAHTVCDRRGYDKAYIASRISLWRPQRRTRGLTTLTV